MNFFWIRDEKKDEAFLQILWSAMMLKNQRQAGMASRNASGLMVWRYTSQVFFLLGEVGVQSDGVYFARRAS